MKTILLILTSRYNVTLGVYVTRISDDNILEYRSKERFKMASTVKLPILIYLMHLAQSNKIDLDYLVDVQPNDLVLGSGYLGYFLSRPGLKISLYTLFEPMMTVSESSVTDII